LAYFAAAMSRSRRIALVVAAVVVAVLAFVIAQPGDDEDAGPSADATPAQTQTESETGAQTEGETGGADTEDQTDEQPAPPPEPEVTRIRVTGGEVAGGAQDIEVESGDVVRIVVTADAADEIHLHGYDIERTAAPGRPARFRFKANLEGAFEMESHVAEDAGLDPLVARLVVAPS